MPDCSTDLEVGIIASHAERCQMLKNLQMVFVDGSINPRGHLLVCSNLRSTVLAEQNQIPPLVDRYHMCDTICVRFGTSSITRQRQSLFVYLRIGSCRGFQTLEDLLL